MKERLTMASEFENLIGKYYSVGWLRRNILHQSEEDIDRMTKEIDAEMKAGILQSPDDEV
jgi:hypothetical protein